MTFKKIRIQRLGAAHRPFQKKKKTFYICEQKNIEKKNTLLTASDVVCCVAETESLGASRHKDKDESSVSMMQACRIGTLLLPNGLLRASQTNIGYISLQSDTAPPWRHVSRFPTE